ncbi:MAG: hypothetical protein R3B72_50130 [Polyangiaceae bacterium]
MSATNSTAPAALVELSNDHVTASITDGRVDVLDAFGDLSAAQQEQLARDAWCIGLRAFMNAYAQAREARLEDVGKTLVEDLERQLHGFVDKQQQTLLQVLARYFDPSDGSVMTRLQEFTKDEGALARLLQSYLAPQNSVLAETLARQVGQQSDLFKKLSPTESDGLVQVLESRLKQVMTAGHEEVVRALDPLQPDGAVARFLRALREELEKADQDRHKQLSTALAALDANDEQSLVSRMMRETHQARRSLLQAINPDAPDSPMAIIKNTLSTMLSEHMKSQREAMELQQARQEKLERDIREALARLEARRESDRSSPRGGGDFETAFVEYAQSVLAGGPYIAEPTGNSVGLLPRRKVGDLVVRFTAESAFDGAALVVESKRDASYTVAKALDELDLARKNRGAGAGVFVLARSHAPHGFPYLARYGHNILVQWDDEDPYSDPYLHAALLLGLALATRKRHIGDPGDLQALADIEQRITAEISRLDKIRKANEGIRRQSDTIAEEVRKGQDKLDLLIRKAKSTLQALNVELHDEEMERESPIALPEESSPRALLAASGDDIPGWDD